MDVLGILGSPRRDGNTSLLLDKVLDGMRVGGADVEKLVLSDYSISPCQECNGCADTGNCVMDDDMQMMYPKLLNADWVILASPIFFYGVTAQTKTLIDRCQALWSRKYLLQKTSRPNRCGMFISVGATKGAKLFDGAMLTVKYFFDAIDVKYCENLFFKEIDKKGDIKNHPTAFQEAWEIGKRLAES
ncbi:MAG: flavodoxin family protein [Thermodesulfobacteriota bacterium]|nr:flavodoxin family protein [Thermodesulfobacteriota bacterium]